MSAAQEWTSEVRKKLEEFQPWYRLERVVLDWEEKVEVWEVTVRHGIVRVRGLPPRCGART